MNRPTHSAKPKAVIWRPGDTAEAVDIRDIKTGDVFHPSHRMHAESPRLHAICGLRKHAKEEAALRAKISRWSRSHVWTCEDTEGGGAVLRDQAGRRFVVFASLLVRATASKSTCFKL